MSLGDQSPGDPMLSQRFHSVPPRVAVRETRGCQRRGEATERKSCTARLRPVSIDPPTGKPADSPAERATTRDAREPSEGFSQFLCKVLDQLSLSSWLPATMFVGCGTLLLQLAEQRNMNIPAAVRTLIDKPLGILIIVIFALVLTAIIIQAFSFDAIRFLEGYWGATRLGAALAAIKIAGQLRKMNRLKARHSRQQMRAFELARIKMLKSDISRTWINILEDQIYAPSTRSTDSYARDDLDNANKLGWRQFSSAQRLGPLDRLIARRGDYPVEHRVLPTRLGNLLRSIEDSLGLDYDNFEGMVMSRYESINPRLLMRHDQYRTRLDMYCILLFVFISLALLSIAVVINSSNHLASVAFPAAFVFWPSRATPLPSRPPEAMAPFCARSKSPQWRCRSVVSE
jgi:hypothetical protein